MASERSVNVGGVKIGGGAPVVVQSMTTTKTHDVPATTAQIAALVSAGCEIVRVAVPKTEDAEALGKIVRFSPVPIIADIHFNASLALKAIDQGVAAVRINPGNIGGPEKVEQVVRAAKKAGIPMRIGANSGSLPKHLEELAQEDQAEALVEAALEEVRLLETLDYRDFKISVKSSHVPTMIRAYRMLADKVPYPLHLGVTEAGTAFSGSIKSSVGIGTLLAQGIGDTIRVSLAADPVEEPKVAFEILKALGLRERGPVMIACPSCGRDNVGVHTLAEEVEARLQTYPEAFEVAVLGCAVNGPGESGDADFGIAGGRDVGFIYAHGRVLKKVSSDILVDELFHEIDRWIADGMFRPKRLEDGEAGGARHGRSVCDPARVACRDNDDRPGLTAFPADPSGRTRRRRGGQPQAARARGGYIRQVGAGLWSFLPLGWRVHRKVEQIVREEMDAIGAQEFLAPVLTPVELWEATGRDKIAEIFRRHGPRGPALHPADHARGDVHVPRPRDPVVQGAAAALVPLPDEGPRRASSARRPAPRPRVHHEGRVLVRPRRGERATSRSSANRAAYHMIFERCGVEAHEVKAESGIMGGELTYDFLAPSGSGENTLVRCENGDYAADAEVARGIPRAPALPAALGAPEEIETPGVTTCEALAEFLTVDLAATSKAMPVTTEDGRVVLALDPRRRPPVGVEAPVGAEDRLAPFDGRRDPRGVRRVGRLARPGRLHRRGRRRRDAARRPVRRRREQGRLPPPRRRGRARLRAAVRRPPRADRGRPLPRVRRRAHASRPRSRSAISSTSPTSTARGSTRRSSTRTARRSRFSAAATGSARAA